MKLRNFFILLLVLALLDSYIVYIYPPDFTYTTMSFVPHTAFLALLLLTYDKRALDRILLGLFIGLLTDFFFVFSFPTSTLLYPLFTWFVGKVYDWMHEDFRWVAVASIGVVILLDTIPFLWFKILQQVHVSIIMWFTHMEMTTLVFHLLIMFALYYSIQGMNYWSAKRQAQKNQQARRKYRKLRSSRK